MVTGTGAETGADGVPLVKDTPVPEADVSGAFSPISGTDGETFAAPAVSVKGFSKATIGPTVGGDRSEEPPPAAVVPAQEASILGIVERDGCLRC